MTLKDLVPFGKKEVPVRKDADHPFALFRKEMDSLFDTFFRGFDLQLFEGTAGAFSPKVDVAEDEKEIRVNAELPGMDEKDIDVSLSMNSLTIRGEKREEKEEKGKDYYQMERAYGSFSRTIPLSAEVDESAVRANFKKGVLSITLPKAAKASETKKISVKVE
jgi:HSP20 family protein